MSTKRQTNDSSSPTKGGGGFMFGKARSSVRILRRNSNQVTNGSDSTTSTPSSNPFGRWLRGLGGSNHNSNQNNNNSDANGVASTEESLNRANPAYHSEGKGLRKRSKNKDKRRYSFNEKVDKSAAAIKANGTKEAAKAEPLSPAAKEAAGPKAPQVPSLPMSRSTPNLQQPVSIFYINDAPAPAGITGAGGHHLQQPPPPSRSDSVGSLPASSSSGLSSWGSIQDASKAGWEQAPTPPVRDASSLKALRYGPGHEKFPSWPVPAAADQLPAVKQCCHNTGGSHRSKSWTEQTDYPKEPNGPYYSRPYLRRQASSGNTLKTVQERSEAALMFSEPPPPEQPHLRSLPTLDREGQAIGDLRYLAPSPPERDASVQKTEHHQMPLLTQADVEEYARTYDSALMRHQSTELFSNNGPVHQSQGSYAQSEGYHSYVSSTDSTNTPFLDRLRQDSQGGSGHHHHHHHQASVASSGVAWDDDEVASTMEPSADQWRGSLSDMSVTSSSMGLSSLNTRQLIAHSSKVQTPQRHMSESVLILSSQHNQPNLSKNNSSWLRANRSFNQSTGNIRNSALHNFSVAERVNELERHNFSCSTSALSAPKLQPRPKPTNQSSYSSSNLKAMQKEALLNYYERKQQQTNSSSSWKSEPYLAPPPAPPRSAAVEAYRRPEQPDFERHLSDPEPCYLAKPVSLSPHSDGSLRRQSHSSSSSISSGEPSHLSPHHVKSPLKKLPSPTDTSADLLGPLIMGAPIYLDDWVPERPPKKPHLRANIGRPLLAPQQPPQLKRCSSSPEPPPPPTPPPPSHEDEVFQCDEPLPPPPNDIDNVCTDVNNSKSSSIPSTVVSSSSASLLRCNVDAPCSIEGSYKRTPETPVKAAVVTTALTATTRASIASSVAIGVAPALASSAPRILRPLSNKQRDPLVLNNNNNITNLNNNNNNTNSVKNSLDGVAKQFSALSTNNILTKNKGLYEKRQDDQRLIIPPKKPTYVRSTLNSDCTPAAPVANRSLKPVVPSLPPPPTVPPPTEPCESLSNHLDASSQTDLSSRTEAAQEPSSNKEAPAAPASNPVPSRLASEVAQREEEECAQLTRDLASQLPPSDRLQEILAPQVEKIKPTEFVEGLFQIRPPSRASSKSSASSTKPLSPPPPSTPPKESSPNKSADTSASETLPANSVYFTTSEPKAMFLTRYSKDISTSNPPMTENLQRKKEELVARLSKKLEILKEEQTVMAMEIKINEMLGLGLQDRLKEASKHQEAAKLALHVDEVGKITSLLLGLSGRLARVENALVGLNAVPKSEEKDTLLAKREKLSSQLTEAKYLKECIDKRSTHLAKMLAKILDGDASTDFEHFICMKASLQVGTRELDDRIGLGEEQLAALKETLAA
ncbi:protein Shroom isoform X1 [Cloeon dipterum]|uniref:protein Shroom isoform X1 n=2 Tax=Cloeon dipterum TaxID=197152 RepID=UPI00321FD06D